MDNDDCILISVPEEEEETTVTEDESDDDQFVEGNGQCDVTLVIENQKIRVSKAVLCIASPVFKAMMESDFKEKEESEIPLPGKNYEDFVDFLNCIYPHRMSHVTGTTVYRILPLASEYQVEHLLESCEKILIAMVKFKHTTNANKLFQHIRLAEKYSLEKLNDVCILIASELSLADIEKGNRSHKISDELLMKIKNTAIQRYELDKSDDRNVLKGLKLNRAKIREEISAAESASYKVEVLRARRLYERFFPNDTELLKKIKNIRKRSFLDEARGFDSPEEFPDLDLKTQSRLLPETLKQKLPGEFSVDSLSKVLIKK